MLKSRDPDRYERTFKRPILVSVCLPPNPQALLTALAEARAADIAEPEGSDVVRFCMHVASVFVGWSNAFEVVEIRMAERAAAT